MVEAVQLRETKIVNPSVCIRLKKLKDTESFKEYRHFAQTYDGSFQETNWQQFTSYKTNWLELH